jgi:protein TonB
MRRIVMPETGFFAQKRNSPTSLGLVILLHAGLIAAVVLIKGPAFQRLVDPIIETRFIPLNPDPPPDRPPPPRHEPQQQPREQIDQPRPLNPMPPLGPPLNPGPAQTHFTETAGSGTLDIPTLPPEPAHVPVRRAAQIDPSSRLQPAYPGSEQRAQHDGQVRVRVTIGPDGRVTDVVLISATSDAFWFATREQALRHWRFRPATVDGRPTEETRVMSVVFRIEDQG